MFNVKILSKEDIMKVVEERPSAFWTVHILQVSVQERRAPSVQNIWQDRILRLCLYLEQEIRLHFRLQPCLHFSRD